jgi:TM2 domain-containing membrane protein YozV
MECNKCRSEIPDNSQFCPQCGSEVTSASEKLTSVRGSILDYDWRKSSGLITGDDGFRYSFAIADWNSDQIPLKGMSVDFVAESGNAKQVFLTSGSIGSGGYTDSKKFICGLLAILVGCFGIHKFYLNSLSKSTAYTTPAIILLLAGTVGWLLVIPGIISIVIAIVEGVIYLTKTEEEFQQTYVIEKHPWF